MTGGLAIASKIAELRREFDGTFALPPPAQREREFENLLAIRVAGNPYAVRLSEISGLVNERKTVPLPSPMPEFLGVAGIRGQVIPVYSFAALLGCGPDGDTPRWLAICGPEDPVALAFAEFESYLRVCPSNICAAQRDEGVRVHMTEVVRAASGVRAVVSVPSIVQAIKGRIGRSSKER